MVHRQNEEDLALGVKAVKQLELSGSDVAKVHGLEEYEDVTQKSHCLHHNHSQH